GALLRRDARKEFRKKFGPSAIKRRLPVQGGPDDVDQDAVAHPRTSRPYSCVAATAQPVRAPEYAHLRGASRLEPASLPRRGLSPVGRSTPRAWRDRPWARG